MIDFIWKDRRASENINDLRGIKRPKQLDKTWYAGRQGRFRSGRGGKFEYTPWNTPYYGPPYMKVPENPKVEDYMCLRDEDEKENKRIRRATSKLKNDMIGYYNKEENKWRVINVRLSKYRLSRRYHNYLMEMSKKVRR